jgi:hypothetical protein
MKKCSTSLSTEEIQIKMILRVHLTPIRIDIIKKTKQWQCKWGCGGKKTHTIGENGNSYSHYVNHYEVSLKI